MVLKDRLHKRTLDFGMRAERQMRRFAWVPKRMYMLPVNGERAKLFEDEGSQAVRLPQSCQFPESTLEVLARREGRLVILEPLDEWSKDFKGILGAWSEEIPRPPSSPQRDPFE